VASPERRRLGAALVAALAAAALQPAPAAAAPCTLSVTALPPRLHAGDDRTVRLHVSGPGAEARASAATATPPRLAASVGRVEAARPDGDGWSADWLAPEAGVPGVAVLAALGSAATGAELPCGYAALGLDGVGDAEVKTRPGAVVEVRIADRTFGPVRANALGVALVPVEVPPGVDAVHHGDRRIPLPLPPVAHAALFLAVPSAPADREVEVPALLVAVTADGQPADGPAPVLSSSSGTLAPPEPAGRGAWRVTWSLPPGPAAEASLSAALPGEPAVRVALARTAGAPTTAHLTLDRPQALAGQSAPVTAEVVLTDAAGNPAEGAPAAEVDAGSVTAPERTGPGRWRLRWRVPARLEGRRSATLAVRAEAATATAGLALLPGGPASLTLAPEDSHVTTDGLGSVNVVATVADAHGNPVDEPPTRREAQAGQLDAPRPAGPGRFTMAYRPGPVAAPGDAELVVELPPLTARTRLRLRPPLRPVSLAASLGALVGGGGGLGLSAAAEAGAWRWLGSHEVGLSLAAAFTRRRDERTVPVPGGSTGFEGEVRTLSLLAQAGWRRTAGARIALRLSAGAGAGRVESLVSAGGGPTLPEARWVPALAGAAAAGLRLGPGRAFLEARATWLAEAALDTLQGTPVPLTLALGYELDAL